MPWRAMARQDSRTGDASPRTFLVATRPRPFSLHRCGYIENLRILTEDVTRYLKTLPKAVHIGERHSTVFTILKSVPKVLRLLEAKTHNYEFLWNDHLCMGAI